MSRAARSTDDDGDLQTLQVALGQAICGRRRELCLSRRRLAERLGQRDAWLVRVEGGKINLAFATLVRLAQALGLSPAGLVALAEWLEA